MAKRKKNDNPDGHLFEVGAPVLFLGFGCVPGTGMYCGPSFTTPGYHVVRSSGGIWVLSPTAFVDKLPDEKTPEPEEAVPTKSPDPAPTLEMAPPEQHQPPVVSEEAEEDFSFLLDLDEEWVET